MRAHGDTHLRQVFGYSKRRERVRSDEVIHSLGKCSQLDEGNQHNACGTDAANVVGYTMVLGQRT